MIGHPLEATCTIFPQFNIASGLEKGTEKQAITIHTTPPQLYVALRQFVQFHSVHAFSVTPQSITILVIHPDTAPQCPNQNQTTGFPKKKKKKNVRSVYILFATTTRQPPVLHLLPLHCMPDMCCSLSTACTFSKTSKQQ
jgi:hypothetical protein